jgi:hypothetical protein
VNLLEKNAYKKNLLQISLALIVVYIIIVSSIQIFAPNKVIKPENFPNSCPDESKNCTMIGPIPHRGDNISEIRFESNDFVVNLHCEDEEVVMYVYSKSRLGISDLNVNNDRVESFTNFMLETEISTSKCIYGD